MVRTNPSFEITLPRTVNYIGNRAFMDNSRLVIKNSELIDRFNLGGYDVVVLGD
jgi:hypothetical protein